MISGYRLWGQLDHADEYILYPENFGADMSLDETFLSNGDVYTILTNKTAHGGRGALAAMVRGVSSDTVSAILRKVPLRQRLKVKNGYDRPFFSHDADCQKRVSRRIACQ